MVGIGKTSGEAVKELKKIKKEFTEAAQDDDKPRENWREEGTKILNMLQSIGVTEWLVIILVVVLVFGGRKIPELFKGLTETVREFKKASKDDPQKEE